MPEVHFFLSVSTLSINELSSPIKRQEIGRMDKNSKQNKT